MRVLFCLSRTTLQSDREEDSDLRLQHFPAFEAPVIIDPAAMRYLRKRPQLVGLKASDIGTEKPAGRLEATYDADN